MVGLESLPATFTTRAARQAGVHPQDLLRWRDESEVTELSRGRNAPRIVYPPTSVFRFDAETFEVGISQVEAARESSYASTIKREPWWT